VVQVLQVPVALLTEAEVQAAVPVPVVLLAVELPETEAVELEQVVELVEVQPVAVLRSAEQVLTVAVEQLAELKAQCRQSE